MKLLFDQNISFRILSKINIKFSGSEQVRHLGLEDKPDIGIIQKPMSM
jgi:predicted nuclease of predicted toxin-antitoxin system